MSRRVFIINDFEAIYDSWFSDQDFNNKEDRTLHEKIIKKFNVTKLRRFGVDEYPGSRVLEVLARYPNGHIGNYRFSGRDAVIVAHDKVTGFFFLYGENAGTVVDLDKLNEIW